ncbi:ubiquinone biosynthesis protein UbiJ [Marinospirillum celere]|uniref:Ubiquinone biosynthesis protein UbiJ n=1 Tax=Marinospirillum celere TaxID=1122252 RepID=A0A1I1FDH3_9GAMM|nr:SCP2 sterol-binding domain-containing protein [Marinospirillum celere]SFB97331.1 ubiquinone biosynthesis protein UbiJ [Marinospirillum celere]
MQIPLAALTALESLVNPLIRQLSAQGSLTSARLAQLQGSWFEIGVLPWGMKVYLQVTEEGLFFQRHLEDRADAWIETTPQAYLKMATSANSQEVLFGPEVAIGGDTQKLEWLQELLAALGLDAGDVLTRLAGPLPVASIQAGLGQLLGWGRRASAAAQQDLKDYLEDETGILPGQNSLHLLEDGLEELRLDVDRLEARVGLLEAATKKQAGES